MARDLREILAGLRIPADIERIGDYAANVAAARSRWQGAAAAADPGPAWVRAGAWRRSRSVAIAAYRDNDADAALELREDDARLDAHSTPRCSASCHP